MVWVIVVLVNRTILRQNIRLGCKLVMGLRCWLGLAYGSEYSLMLAYGLGFVEYSALTVVLL